MNKCQKCNTEFEGVFCPSCGTNIAPESTSFQSQQPPYPQITEKTQNNFLRKNLLSLIIIALLVVNIGLSTLMSGGTSGGSETVEDKIQSGKAWNEYTKKIGKQDIVFKDDKIVKSEYGSDKITATIQNKSSKKMDSVSVYIVFEKDGKYIATESAFAMNVPAKGQEQVTLYVPEGDFDEYKVDYISAYSYE